MQAERAAFRFLHVSTDEVYGIARAQPIPPSPRPTRYEPNSPYSASKAASDHLVRAWHHTYGLPVLTTNCSNNYGPYHFPEKLIPLMIVNALAGKPLPVYGDGLQVRDWLYVKDHCSAIRARAGSAAAWARPTTSAAGTKSPTSRSCTPSARCSTSCGPRADGTGYASQITYVTDRPGHDRRYAIDARKIERELGWKPAETFDTGIRKTVQWYLDQPRLGGPRAKRRLPRVGRRRNYGTAARAPMKILLLGKNGQVGWELQRSAGPAGRAGGAGPSTAPDLCGDLGQPAGLAATVQRGAPGRHRQCRRPHRRGQGRERARTGAHHQRHWRPACWRARPPAWAPGWCTTAPTTCSTAAASAPWAEDRRHRPAQRLRPDQARRRAAHPAPAAAAT